MSSMKRMEYGALRYYPPRMEERPKCEAKGGHSACEEAQQSTT